MVEGELYFPGELAPLALDHEGDLDPGLLEVACEGTQRSRPGLALDGKGFDARTERFTSERASSLAPSTSSHASSP